MRVPPRPVLAGDGQFTLDCLVVRAELVVVDGPVGADPVEAVGVEVGRMEAGGVAGVVHHRPAHAATRVVLAHLDRVGAADDALLVPVQLVRAGLVGDPVLVGMPERAGFDDHDPPTGPGQTLGQDRPSGAGADDADVDLVGVVVAAHGVLAGQIAAVHVEQETRIIVFGSYRPFEQVADHPPGSGAVRTGSSDVAPAFSKGSRVLSGPRRM